MAFYNLFFYLFQSQKGGKALDAIPNSAMLQTRIWGWGGCRICLFSTEIPAPGEGQKEEGGKSGFSPEVKGGTLKKRRRKQRDGYFNIFLKFPSVGWLWGGNCCQSPQLGWIFF